MGLTNEQKILMAVGAGLNLLADAGKIMLPGRDGEEDEPLIIRACGILAAARVIDRRTTTILALKNLHGGGTRDSMDRAIGNLIAAVEKEIGHVAL
jgi:hypothetical protein